MNPYAIPSLFTAIIVFGSGAFIIVKNPKSSINIWYTIFCLCAFTWIFSCFIGYSTRSIALGNILGKIVYLGVTGIPITGYIFVRHLLKLETKRSLYYISLIFYACAALIIFKTDWIISGAWKYYFSRIPFYPKAGKFHLLYMVPWGFLTIQLFTLLHAGCKNKMNLYSPKEITKIKYVLWAFIAAWLLGPIDFVPNYGIAFYPPGSLGVAVMIVIIGYAIFKHHLMDINIVVKKGLIYSILVSLITLIYLVFVFIGERFLQGVVGYRSILVSLISACTIAIIFIPLRNKIQRFLDHRFFKGTLESLASEQERLRERLFHTEKLAYVGQLASSVAHEIRNPLTAIKTYVEYLPKKYSDPEFKDKFDKLIPKEIERINSVLCQLLNLAKPRSSEFRQVHMHLIIDSTLRLLENNLKKKKIAVKTNFCSDEIIIQGDEEQLRQVFLNLFLNAIEAMNEGGNLTIETRPDPGCLMLDTSKNKKLESRIKNLESRFAEISISDTGCGISEESLKKLFTPFFTTKKEGVGLGMVITKEIIEQHKGKISVESMIGEGTRFILAFPLQTAK